MPNKIALEFEPAIAMATNRGGRPRKELDQHTFEKALRDPVYARRDRRGVTSLRGHSGSDGVSGPMN